MALTNDHSWCWHQMRHQLIRTEYLATMQVDNIPGRTTTGGKIEGALWHPASNTTSTHHKERITPSNFRVNEQ